MGIREWYGKYIKPVKLWIGIVLVFSIIFVVLFVMISGGFIPPTDTSFLWSIVTGTGTLISAVVTAIVTIRNVLPFLDSSLGMEIKNCPKVLFWIIDGLNTDAFLKVANKNRNLRYLMNEGYYTEAVSIFPSITPAAHAALITGCYPCNTRIPAFDWVEVSPSYGDEKGTRKYMRSMPDFKRIEGDRAKKNLSESFFEQLGDAFDLNQKYLSPAISTIFETLGEDHFTECIKEWIHRGADDFIGTTIKGALQDLASRLGRKSSMVALLTALYREGVFKIAGFTWGNRKTLADLVVYWKTGTDSVSHHHGPNHKEVKKETDEAITKLAETMRFYRIHTNKPLYVFITADHSQSEIRKYSNLIEGFKDKFSEVSVGTRENRDDKELDQDVIIAPNDRAAFLYIFKKGLLMDIVDWLKKREDLDFIIYRTESNRIRVIQVSYEGKTRDKELADFFKGWNDNGQYPFAERRITGLAKGDKWGNIAVSLKKEYTLDRKIKDDKKTRDLKEHPRGDHGGLNKEDSVVPLLMWGPRIKKSEKKTNDEDNFTGTKEDQVEIVDIAPTIAFLLGKPHDCDGKVIKEAIKPKEEEKTVKKSTLYVKTVKTITDDDVIKELEKARDEEERPVKKIYRQTISY